MPISQPDITFNIIPSVQKLSNKPTKVLIVGQKLAAGTAISGALVPNIENDNSEDVLFGTASHIAGMIRNYKKINKETRVDAISLTDNAAGVAATGTIVFTGNATTAGTLTVVIGSAYNHTYQLAVAVGDTPTIIAAALVALINADLDQMVTASASVGTVTLTCDHKGTIGNNIGVSVTQKNVGGTTFTVSGMASGATDPVLTGILDAIADERYQTIVWPGSYAKNVVLAELATRFNTTNQVLDGVAITTFTDTFANHKTAANAQNTQNLVMFTNKKVTDALWKGGALFEMDDVISSQFAAIRGLRFTEDANISQYVISTYGVRDSFGGPAISSMPYFNTPFYLLPIIPVGKQFTRVETEELLTAGASVIGNNSAGNMVIAGEVATTYKTDVAGNVDLTYKLLPYVDTAVACREYFYNNNKARFAQSRLTNGDLLPNRSMANPDSIKSYNTGLYSDLASDDYVLLQAGEQARKYFIDNLSVDVDLLQGKVSMSMKAPIVTQLRTILATMQISFSAEG